MMIALTVVGVLIGLVLAFTIAAKAKEAREEKRGWRLRFTAGDVRYEEKKEGDAWVGIEIEALRRGHGIHGLRFRSAETWRSYPVWAATRRAQIVARVKEECPGFHFYEESGPNKAPEPTPISVTSPAAQEPRQI